MSPTIDRSKITAIVLAGGQGSRMDGRDKGLVLLQDRPLVQWVIDVLAPQVKAIVISANRNHEIYKQLGYPVVADAMADFQGPLAGVAAALQQVVTPYVMVVAADTPLLPADMVQRLAKAIETAAADVAVVEINGDMQPAHMLLRTKLKEDLERYLASGQRKLYGWIEQQEFVAVPFAGDDNAFMNINDEQQLTSLQAEMASRK